MLNKLYCIVMWLCMKVSGILAMLIGLTLLIVLVPILLIAGIICNAMNIGMSDKTSDALDAISEWYIRLVDEYKDMSIACYEDIEERWNS